MKIKFLIYILILPVIARADPRPFYRFNLPECTEMAMKNNEEIKASGYDIDIIRGKKIEATKRYIPVVKHSTKLAPVPRDLDNPADSFFSGDISVFGAFRLEAGAPVYTFGRLSTAQALADLGIDLAGLQKVKKSDEVALNMYKLYNGILLARELKSLANEALDAINKKITDMEGEENTDQLAILKLKVVLYEVERRLDEAETKESVALATIKTLMGMEDDVDFDIKDKSLQMEKFEIKTLEHFQELSKQTQPEYALLEKGVAAKALKIELDKKEYYPKLILGGFVDVGRSPGIRGDEDDNAFTNPFNYTKAGVGFDMSGELDFRKIKSQVEQSKADYLKTIAQKRAAFGGLKVDLKKTYLEVLQYRQLVQRAEKEQRAARQIVFLTKSNLEIGLGDKKDYNDALQSYLVFQGRYYEAVFYYNTTVAQLKQKTGQLYKRPAAPSHEVD